MVIGAVGACRPAGGGLQLERALGADGVDEGLPFGVVRDVPAARAEASGIFDGVPVVEAAVGEGVDFVSIVNGLGAIGGGAPVGGGGDGVAVGVVGGAEVLETSTGRRWR